jgi:K+-transporting ATPase ATPase C chain
MKDFFSHIRGAVMATLVLAIICCGVYPLIVFGVSQLVFRDKANGSLILDPEGTVRGSKLLGQNFSDPKYFH